MKDYKILFYKDIDNKIIDEKKTDKLLKYINELLSRTKITDPEYYKTHYYVIANEIKELFEYGYNLGLENKDKEEKKVVESTDKGVSLPMVAIAGVRPKMFNKTQIEQIKALKDEGLSNYMIAAKFKCSEKTIRNYLKEY